MADNPQVKVYADFHEDCVIRNLEKYGCDIITKALPVGDFILSDDVAVERKTTQDFVSSIVDGRLFEQLANMRENFAKPLLIVEGAFFGDSGVHENAIRGALTSAALDYGVPILWSRDERDTAGYLYVIAKREQIGGRTFAQRGSRKPPSPAELQKYVVSSLPGIGGLTAANLLEKFGTVENVFKASEKELRSVEKIGKKKAKGIRELVTKPYEK